MDVNFQGLQTIVLSATKTTYRDIFQHWQKTNDSTGEVVASGSTLVSGGEVFKTETVSKTTQKWFDKGTQGISLTYHGAMLNIERCGELSEPSTEPSTEPSPEPGEPIPPPVIPPIDLHGKIFGQIYYYDSAVAEWKEIPCNVAYKDDAPINDVEINPKGGSTEIVL